MTTLFFDNACLQDRCALIIEPTTPRRHVQTDFLRGKRRHGRIPGRCDSRLRFQRFLRCLNGSQGRTIGLPFFRAGKTSTGHERIDSAALGFAALSWPKPYDLDRLSEMLAGVRPA